MAHTESPGFNSVRIQRASRSNGVEQGRLQNTMGQLDREKVRSIRLVNQYIRRVNLTLDVIQASSGDSPEALPPDAKLVDDDNDADRALGTIFMYGERQNSRRFGKFRHSADRRSSRSSLASFRSRSGSTSSVCSSELSLAAAAPDREDGRPRSGLPGRLAGGAVGTRGIQSARSSRTSFPASNASPSNSADPSSCRPRPFSAFPGLSAENEQKPPSAFKGYRPAATNLSTKAKNSYGLPPRNQPSPGMVSRSGGPDLNIVGTSVQPGAFASRFGSCRAGGRQKGIPSTPRGILRRGSVDRPVTARSSTAADDDCPFEVSSVYHFSVPSSATRRQQAEVLDFKKSANVHLNKNVATKFNRFTGNLLRE